jgi:hypothetical protein
VFSEFLEVLILVVRGALFAGLCWGAWLCLGEHIARARPENPRPLERFASFAILILLLTALGGLARAA